MVTPARRLAASVLARVQGGGATLGDVLADDPVSTLEPRERAFLHELVLGTLRHRGWLDHVLESATGRPLSDTPPRVRDALRLGAYQLLYLRVPAHAAVSESVGLARAAGRPGRTPGFVNAVLRRIGREGPPPEPDPESDSLHWLTTAGSLPRWLAQRWLERHGPVEAVARARAFLRPPPMTIRFNPRMPDGPDRAAAAGLELREAPVPGAWEAGGGPVAQLAVQGLLYVQDAGSQAVAHLASTAGTVLDACAAPGGKTLVIADDLGSTGRVVAAEVAPRRLRALSTLVRRWGTENVSVVGADALSPPYRRPFDGVLVDAPCSGLGTLGRRPDVRWRLAPNAVERHAERQRALLEALHHLVRPGGRLVYATCSVEHEENEGVVRPFLATHPQFEVEPLPDWCADLADGPFVKMNPARDPGDAFFAARLRRS